MSDNHEDITTALRAGDHKTAARLAARKARAGEMDDEIAAVLYLHAAEDAPERAGASEWLEVSVAADTLDQDLTSPAAWQAMVKALLDAGRFEDALQGVRLAVEAGLVNSDAWCLLVIWQTERGDLERADRLIGEATARFPQEADFWWQAHLKVAGKTCPQPPASH